MTEPTEETTHRALLTPTQLADRWGVSTGHLANLRHHGEGIGYLKIGSRVAYRFTDVVAFENEHYVSIDGVIHSTRCAYGYPQSMLRCRNRPRHPRTV